MEFKSHEVANIVCETMDNYLMFGHILKCKIIPAEQLHPKTFVGANRKFKTIPWNKIQRIKQNKAKTPEETEKITARLLAKEEEKRNKLKELGINYEFPGYAACINSQ